MSGGHGAPARQVLRLEGNWGWAGARDPAATRGGQWSPQPPNAVQTRCWCLCAALGGHRSQVAQAGSLDDFTRLTAIKWLKVRLALTLAPAHALRRRTCPRPPSIPLRRSPSAANGHRNHAPSSGLPARGSAVRRPWSPSAATVAARTAATRQPLALLALRPCSPAAWPPPLPCRSWCSCRPPRWWGSTPPSWASSSPTSATAPGKSLRCAPPAPPQNCAPRPPTRPRTAAPA